MYIYYINIQKTRNALSLMCLFNVSLCSYCVFLFNFQFLALTEEDLNKYDLTQGAKKKLKTQLELQKSVDKATTITHTLYYLYLPSCVVLSLSVYHLCSLCTTPLRPKYVLVVTSKSAIQLYSPCTVCVPLKLVRQNWIIVLPLTFSRAREPPDHLEKITRTTTNLVDVHSQIVTSTCIIVGF